MSILDKMMKIAGKAPNGTAKAIRVDENGNIGTQPTGSIVDNIAVRKYQDIVPSDWYKVSQSVEVVVPSGAKGIWVTLICSTIEGEMIGISKGYALEVTLSNPAMAPTSARGRHLTLLTGYHKAPDKNLSVLISPTAIDIPEGSLSDGVLEFITVQHPISSQNLNIRGIANVTTTGEQRGISMGIRVNWLT